jgi:8-oxo-dGTP pyrophosphatase MutT (NUDIX family)
VIEELLNIYDASGAVVGARKRREAKAEGLLIGAVNVLAINAAGSVLLQKRPEGRENGGFWDKSVGGHVSAGEEFDVTAVREAGEELFSDPRSPRVRLAPSEAAFRTSLNGLKDSVVLYRASTQKNLRDVRVLGEGRLRNVLYHVAIYLGRTDVPEKDFVPQKSEIDDLRYFPPDAIDRMLADGKLAPNMAFLWLTHAQGLLALSGA